jgi:nicotinamidase-related amidase
VVSCIESHRPSEPINGFPLHCIDGTQGQRKPEFTKLEPRILIEADNSLALPPDIMHSYRQIIFRKRARDVLGNPKTDRFLTQLQSDEFILFGVGLERAIRGLALGLLSRHKCVTVVADACGMWSHADADLVIRQLTAKGITMITTETLTAPPPVAPASPPRRIVYHGRVLNRHHPAGHRAETSNTRRLRNA